MPAEGQRPERMLSLDEIIQAFEAGGDDATLDEQGWLARYPHVAAQLAEFFEDRRQLVARPAPAAARSFGNYQLIGEIGHGGMGIVYKAYQASLDRTVAVKTIRGGHLASDSDVRRFRQEARCAARLRHPNIVTIHEIGEHEGLHYFSMEYVEGRSLADLLDAEPLAPAEAARYLKAVAEAVQYAHEHGVLHRDLKPANILIDGAGQPHVTDFGLAKLAQGRLESRQTAPGAILGTPSYMSPEQADGRLADVNERSDVYSLGAVLYESLTGKPPFEGRALEETLAKVRSVPPQPPRDRRPEVPEALERICLRCLEKDPGKRYSSARELAHDLQRFLNGEPVLAAPVSNWMTRLRRASAIASLETNISNLGLLTGLAVALFIGLGPYIGLPLAPGRAELNTMAAIVALMAIWWVTEAIPSAATAFLPLVLLPWFGIAPLAEVSRLYMHEVILTALGGFLIITAVEESGLIRRLALRMLAFTGDQPRRVVLGFMIATAGVSLWVSNVATTIIMMPVAMSVLSEIEERTPLSAHRRNFATALMLGVAYAATIGGMATPFGTLATQKFLATHGPGLNISFVGWMKIGIPFTLALGAVCWFLLTRDLFPLAADSALGGASGIRSRLAKLGPMSGAERRMLLIAVLTPLLWIFSEPVAGWGWAPLLGLPGRGANAITAIAVAIVCFALPSGSRARPRLMEWDWTMRVPWGVLFLFGGGLALAEGIHATRLDSYFGDLLASFLRDVPSDLARMFIASGFVAALTQMMSNFATQETTSPILLHVATQLSIDPRLLMVSGILASFCSFLLPASTPPNAIVAGSGKLRVRDMVKAGFLLMLAGLVLDVLIVALLIR